MQTLAETSSGKVDRRTLKKTDEQKREFKARRVDDVLKRWDALPDDAIVRPAVLAALEGCSIPTVWRRTKAGVYPQPLKLSSQQTGWTVGSIRAMRKARLDQVEQPKAVAS